MSQNIVHKPLSAAISNKRFGFTLIELLVVIAIIAILAAILFPVFAKVREKARQTSCLSNEKQIGLAVTQYVQDYDETFPLRNYALWDTHSWPVLIAPYIKSDAVFACPDDSGSGQTSWAGVTMSYASNSLMGWYRAPYSSPVLVGIFGYPVDGGEGSGWSWLNTNGSANLSQLVTPSDDIMIAETHSGDVVKAGAFGNWSAYGTCSGIENWPAFECQGTNGATLDMPPSVNNSDKNPDDFSQAAINGTVSPKHGDKMANFLFADGHVKAIKPSLTWTSTVNEWDISH